MDQNFLSINVQDKDYIKVLYQNFYPLMKKTALSIINDYYAVEDLVQDSFLKLVPKTSLLKSLSYNKQKSYITYTLKHVCIDYIRKKS